jgi:hypothetical protein
VGAVTRLSLASGRPRRAIGAIVAALAAAVLPLLLSVAPVSGAEQPAFGTPTTTAVFLSGISFHEPVSLPAGVRGIDVLIRTEGDDRTLVTPISQLAGGSVVYTMATPSGALTPNTEVTFQVRVALADGSIALGPVARVRYEDTRYTWQTLAGAVVRVHWVDGGDAFGRRALAIAESAVERASTLFGVTESAPIDFYIYADRSAFYDVIGPVLQENVGGQAQPATRTLFANIGSTNIDDPWVSTVVPHELTHIVFASATANPYHLPTHWLNEGLAVYLSAGYDEAARSDVRNAVADGSLMPLVALTDSFPGAASRFSLAYDEAVSAIDFMIRTYGRDALVRLVRSYADGLTDDEAFQAGIGLDVTAFQAAWLADLGARAPSPFGPRPAPAGPVPSGWSEANPTAGLAEGSPEPSGVGGPGTAGADPLPLVVAVVGLAVAGFAIGVAATGAMRRRGGGGPSGTAGPGGADSGARASR